MKENLRLVVSELFDMSLKEEDFECSIDDFREAVDVVALTHKRLFPKWFDKYIDAAISIVLDDGLISNFNKLFLLYAQSQKLLSANRYGEVFNTMLSDFRPLVGAVVRMLEDTTIKEEREVFFNSQLVPNMVYDAMCGRHINRITPEYCFVPLFELENDYASQISFFNTVSERYTQIKHAYDVQDSEKARHLVAFIGEV